MKRLLSVAVRVSLAIVALAAIVFLARVPIARLLLGAIASAAGYHLTIGSLDLGATEAVADDISLSQGAAPFFSARRIRAGYDLRAGFVTRSRRYGLTGISVEAPKLWIERKPDGSWNLPKLGGGGGGAQGGTAVPLRIAGTIRDGEAVLDDARAGADREVLRVGSIDGAYRVDTASSGEFRISGRVTNGGPVALRGFTFARNGIVRARVRAADVALAPLLGIFVDPASVRFSSGRARDLDAQVYAHNGGGLHLLGSASIDGLTLSLAALRRPLTIGGAVTLIDGGLAAKALRGEIASMPLSGAGIIYGLPAVPSFSLAARGAGALADLKSLFTFSHALPIRGDARLRVAVEGPMADPVVLAKVESGAVSYGAYELRDAAATVGYFHDSATILRASGNSDGLALTLRGALDTAGSNAPVVLAATARGSAAAVPYLGHAIGAGTVDAAAAGSGTSDALVGSMALRAAGTDGSRAFSAAAFTLKGLINAPFLATRPGGGRLIGRAVREENGRLAFWGEARRFTLSGSRAVDLGDSGRISGTIDGRVGGAGSASGVALVGEASGTGLRIGPLALDRARAAFVPARGGTHFSALSGAGPFGRFAGSGELAGASLGLRGRYDGSFEALQALTGNLGGHGRLSGPVTVLIDSRRLLVQSSGILGSGASVHGVPVERVAGTLSVSGNRIALAQAIATVAGGSAVAAGGLEHLGVLAGGMSAASLQPAGVPLQSGRLALEGTARFGAAQPAFSGGTIVGAGSSGGVPLEALGSVRYAGGNAVVDASGAVAGAPLQVTGSAAIGSTGPAAFDLRLDGLGLNPRTIAGAPRYLRPLDTRVDVRGRVWGTRASPRVDAQLAAPAGFYGILPFSDFAAHVTAAGGGSAALSDGRARFGSTSVTFEGSAQPGGDLRARLNAPRLDLTDFDLYFYRAGTLGGTGGAFAGLERSGGRFRTNGDVHIQDLVVLRPAGDAAANWHMLGASIAATAALSAGTNFVRAEGRVFPDPAARGLNPLEGALVSASLKAEDHDLLRDAGLVVPPRFPALTGELSSSGVIEGRFPDLALAGTATVRNGSVGRFGFQQASVSGRADRRGGTITDARVYALGSTAQATGYVAFDPAHHIDLRVAFDSPQIHDLIASVANAPIELFGQLEANARVTGTFEQPSIAGAAFMPGGSFRGVTISRAIASYSITGADVQLTDATVDLAKGSIVLAGSLPIRLNPFRIGRRGAQLGFDFAARGVDLSNFEPLLPAGSKLAGVLDGRFGVQGTVRRPALFGSMALTGGSVSTPALSDPLSAVEGTLTFSGQGLTLDRLSAKAGSGLLEATAAGAFRDGELVVAARARATQALLGTPPIGRGVIDANLAYDRLDAGPGTLSGDVALSNATIPFSALYAPAATGSGGSLPDVGLDVLATVGKNVRVRSANVDISGTGSMKLTGSLDDPRLDGSLEASPGGTIVYGNRAFRLQDGSVVFTPQSSLDPQLSADATVSVPNSDPDTSRNPSGNAQISLRVTGSLSNPSVNLSSTPAYSSEQILGLLIGAPALGASLFNQQTIAGVTTTVPTASSSSGINVGQEALGVLNAQFTRLLLAPFENSLSQALGLTSVDLNLGGASALGVSARKLLGKDIFAVYSSSFVYPYRQTFGFELRARRYTSAQFLYYESLATNIYQSPIVSPFENQGSIAAYGLNQTGSQGFTISVRQYYPPP